MGEASAEVTIVIEKPVSDVFAVMSDYNKNVRWQDGVVESRQITSGAPRVGTEVSYTRKVAGRKFEAHATIVTLDADAKIRIESKSRMYHYKGGYDFSSTSDGHTEVHYQGHITTGRLLGMFTQRLADNFASQMTDDLNRLKRMLEAGTIS